MNTLNDIRSRLAMNMRERELVQEGYARFLRAAPTLTARQVEREEARFRLALAGLEQDFRFLNEELSELEAAAGFWSMPGTPLTN